MDDESALLVLPLPSPYLHPNKAPRSRKGHIIKARLTRERRALAREIMLAEQIETGPWAEVEIRAAFYHRVNRRRDADNAISWLKATMDGIADAGIVSDDSSFRWESPEFKVDKTDPRVEILLIRKK